MCEVLGSIPRARGAGECANPRCLKCPCLLIFNHCPRDNFLEDQADPLGGFILRLWRNFDTISKHSMYLVVAGR